MTTHAFRGINSKIEIRNSKSLRSAVLEQFPFNLSLRYTPPHGPPAHGYNAGARNGAADLTEDAPTVASRFSKSIFHDSFPSNFEFGVFPSPDAD